MAPESAGTVFENVRIFDGKAASLLGAVARARAGQDHRDDLVAADHAGRRRDTFD